MIEDKILFHQCALFFLISHCFNSTFLTYLKEPYGITKRKNYSRSLSKDWFVQRSHNNNKASVTTMRYLSLHGICSLIISIGDKALFETTNTPNYTKLLMNSRMFMVLKHFHTSVEVPRRQNLRFQDLMWQSAMDKVFLELLVQRCTILQLFSNWKWCTLCRRTLSRACSSSVSMFASCCTDVTVWMICSSARNSLHIHGLNWFPETPSPPQQ